MIDARGYDNLLTNIQKAREELKQFGEALDAEEFADIGLVVSALHRLAWAEGFIVGAFGQTGDR